MTLIEQLPPAPPRQTRTVVDIVVPVHNEEAGLEPSIRRLVDHLETFPWPHVVTIADNASTDATPEVAARLAAELPGVRLVRLAEKGRGRALKQVWSTSAADVLAYMDVDLSTDLRALLPLVAPLVTGHSDLAIGTRLHRGSRVVRGPKRDVISRSYNLLLRGTLAVSFSDAQCGFKAIRRDVAEALLPLVEDPNWFFDTELLVLAQRSGLRIHEVPVDWVDDPDSRVDLVATAAEDLRGIARLGRGLLTGRLPLDRIRAELHRDTMSTTIGPVVPGVPAGLLGQLLRFAGVGVASTCAYFVVYLLLRMGIGAQPANLIALVTTAIANTAANRRFTFGVTGQSGMLRHHLAGLAAFVVAVGLTSGSLTVLHQFSAAPSRSAEVAVLVVANGLATLLRFLTLRLAIHRRGTP